MNHRDGGTNADVEEALLAREEQFRILAENLPDQVTRFDTSGRIQYVSPSVVRAFGIAPPDVIGKTIMEVATPGGPVGDRRYLDAVLQAVSEGEPNTLEAKWTTKDGERVVEVRHIPEKDASGRVVSVLGIARDITENKRAEHELREREQQYRRIVDTAYEGIWVLDAEAKATFVNARVTEMLGYESEELIGRPLVEFVVAEERADHETRMRNRRQGKSEYYERGLRHKDGSTVWTLVSATPVFDDAGRFAGSFGMFTDITERKRAEAELHEKDLAIRRAYVDVIAAVTGNRLVLMTPEEIDSALGALVAKPRRIASYRSLSTARHEIRDVIEQRFRNGFDLDGFIVGVGEALTNMIKHAEGGRYEVRRRGNVAQVVMRDKGPGVEFNNLPRATLEAGYSTQGTLGMGFTLMLGLTGRILLSTQPGMTVLVLESPPPG